MSDEEWKRFLKWWKENWQMTSPDRLSIELYQRWKEAGEKLEKTF